MRTTVTFMNRPLLLTVSRTAGRRLEQHSGLLLLELELYFSCLIRKRVLVHESMQGRAGEPVTERLALYFRPVVTQSCAMREVERDNPPLTDMPIVRPERYVPHWVTLDVRHDRWQAAFGYRTGRPLPAD